VTVKRVEQAGGIAAGGWHGPQYRALALR
jgi:hypothetical protein